MADIAPDLVNPHEPGPLCGDTHCYSHGVDESAEGGYYRICMECKHVYRTAEDLRLAWAEEVAPAYAPRAAPPTPPAGEILACPLCCHDW